MQCLQRLLYVAALWQNSVMSVMRTVFTRSAKKEAFAATVEFSFNVKKKNYELQTVTILLLLLLKYFRDCSAYMNVGLSATFLRHSIVWISLYFNHGKNKTLVSYLRQKRWGGLFSFNTRSLDKGEAA